ncbi:MAG: hypothetical protein JSV85_04645 [Candidatus Bathyarchaeota archaeon]|nr:MAG: hypothetical protein JSV85_04645 [Candidatus Bathyarchaeota archaeon]
MTKNNDKVWKNFLKRHWKATLLMISAGIVATIAGVFTFLWVVADAQTTGLVPMMLGEWTVGYVVTFILNVILWELIFVGSWVIPLVIVVYVVWYRKLLDDERMRASKASEGSGGFGLFNLITWLIVVWFDGKWDLPFQSWSFDDWVYSWLTAILWDLLIVAIPAGIFVIWWISSGSKQET